MVYPVPLTDQLACVQRELRMRTKAYPRWIQAGRLTDANARHEIEAMAAVVETLRLLVASEAAQAAGQLALLP